MNAKVVTLLLAILMLLGVLAACATPDTGEQESVNHQETESGDVYEQALSKLTVDMKGEDFVVLGRGDAGSSV